MESVSTFEQVLQQEKHIVAQQLRERMRRELEELRPGLLKLLYADGFELYAFEESLCVRRENQEGYLRLEQLKRAQQESQAALLELFDAAVRPQEPQVVRMRVNFFMVLILGTVGFVGVTLTERHPLLGQVLVSVWGGMLLLFLAGEAWPQLQARRPWRDLHDKTPPSGGVALLSPEENPAATNANAQ